MLKYFQEITSWWCQCSWHMSLATCLELNMMDSGEGMLFVIIVTPVGEIVTTSFLFSLLHGIYNGKMVPCGPGRTLLSPHVSPSMLAWSRGERYPNWFNPIFEFRQKMIQFNIISQKFNSKNYLIQKKLRKFNSKNYSIKKISKKIQFKKIFNSINGEVLILVESW